MTCVPTSNVAEVRGEWWLAQCRRFAGAPGETLAAELLSSVGCTVYFPSDKQGMPILPGQYLFAAVTAPEQVTNARNMDYKRHRTQRRILNCSRVMNQEQLKRDLARIQTAISEGIVCGPSRDLKPGITKVLIQGGPLKGFEGAVDRITDEPGIVLVAIETLGREIPVRVPIDCIKIMH